MREPEAVARMNGRNMREGRKDPMGFASCGLRNLGQKHVEFRHLLRCSRIDFRGFSPIFRAYEDCRSVPVRAFQPFSSCSCSASRLQRP